MNTEQLKIPDVCDVLIIGSGAGALIAATRLGDLGVKAVIIERSDRFGGTSAMSGGGIWVPCNSDIKGQDSREAAIEYLAACSEGRVSEERLATYVDTAPIMIDYLRDELGIEISAIPGYSDYRQALPGAADGGRTMLPGSFDGGELGDELLRLREPPAALRLFKRINLSFQDALILVPRAPGWRWRAVKLVARYWLDLSWRRRTRLDRRLVLGGALVGGLRVASRRRGVPLVLNTRFCDFEMRDGRVTGVTVEREGSRHHIEVRCAVIAAAGGFEQNQQLRDRYLPEGTLATYSMTPTGNNAGDVLLAGEKINAATDLTQFAWWCPTIRLPATEIPNVDTRGALFQERAFPHSLMVNRLGDRFANEAMSYHDIGLKMITDNEQTGANLPCWLIFDAQFRAKSNLSSILPSGLMPDSALPSQWWDTVIYRAKTIGELAEKIMIPHAKLKATIERFNGFARTGVDEDFNRGKYAFDSVYCDKSHGPSPTLGVVDKAPFYAIRIDLGDIGTLGGLQTNVDGQVLNRENQPIDGLYAIGNSSASVFGGAYPGAGGTLGPALTFGYRAAQHIAASITRGETAPSAHEQRNSSMAASA